MLVRQLERLYSYKSFCEMQKKKLKYWSMLPVRPTGSVPLSLSKMESAKWSASAKNHLVWLDMEMTGLEVPQHHILEVAFLITDSDLNIIAEGPDIIIHQPEDVLKSMDQWCVENHGKSGLTDASRRSTVIVESAEQQILDFLKVHVPPRKCPVAGNSVYMDRIFLRYYMPRVDSYLHYRIVDVSTIKELCRRWCPKSYAEVPSKAFHHRALSDIKESIAELKCYRSIFFKSEG